MALTPMAPKPSRASTSPTAPRMRASVAARSRGRGGVAGFASSVIGAPRPAVSPGHHPATSEPPGRGAAPAARAPRGRRGPTSAPSAPGRRVEQAADVRVGFGLLGVLLQGLLQRLHHHALAGGGELHAGVGAAGIDLRDAIVAFAHHPQEAGRRGQLLREVLDLAAGGKVFRSWRLAAVEQAQAGHPDHLRVRERQPVAVLRDLGGAHAQHLVRLEDGRRRRELDAPGLVGDGTVLPRSPWAGRGRRNRSAADATARLRPSPARRRPSPAG